jgi:NAD(P)-dependent dehydrogenase (short-subunit alcohol dehydrogenase family)
MATVLITGGNRGIGLQLCTQYSERGDDVIAVVRSSNPELDALPVRVITITRPLLIVTNSDLW